MSDINKPNQYNTNSKEQVIRNRIPKALVLYDVYRSGKC